MNFKFILIFFSLVNVTKQLTMWPPSPPPPACSEMSKSAFLHLEMLIRDLGFWPCSEGLVLLNANLFYRGAILFFLKGLWADFGCG